MRSTRAARLVLVAGVAAPRRERARQRRRRRFAIRPARWATSPSSATRWARTAGRRCRRPCVGTVGACGSNTSDRGPRHLLAVERSDHRGGQQHDHRRQRALDGDPDPARGRDRHLRAPLLERGRIERRGRYDGDAGSRRHGRVLDGDHRGRELDAGDDRDGRRELLPVHRRRHAIVQTNGAGTYRVCRRRRRRAGEHQVRRLLRRLVDGGLLSEEQRPAPQPGAVRRADAAGFGRRRPR